MTKTQALTARSDMYAWRKVALANQGEARQLGVDLEALAQVMMRVTDKGLVLYHKDTSVAARSIEAALGGLGTVIPRQEVVAVTPTPEVDPAAEIFDPDGSLARVQEIMRAAREEEGKS